MFAWPVLLPALTNREDLLLTVSLFDDDTGDALDVSGRVLAAPGDFTASAWTITDGSIVTTSATNLTIKDYPFGSEMQAISLTVGTGLGILPGDFATIADTATLKNTMSGYVTSYASATGALVMQIGSSFDFEIRDDSGDGNTDDFWSQSFIDSAVAPPAPVIQAQLGNGITVVGAGLIQIRIPASNMRQLYAKTYDVGVTMFDGSDTRQIAVAQLPVLKGRTS